MILSASIPLDFPQVAEFDLDRASQPIAETIAEESDKKRSAMGLLKRLLKESS